MIVASGLSKAFGPVQAIDKVDLNVEKGDIFGLVGPDGAGKTTLLRTICGLITPDQGEVIIAGHSGRASALDRENLGYMPQRFSLYGELSVMENIAFFASLYRIDKQTLRQRAEEILSLTDLIDFKDRFADALSGGMKQKLALTCALITRPTLLILDEPTYGVDPVSRKEFWKILYRLNQEGMTVLVSTAYMDEAEQCSRVAFINQGKICAVDTPAGLRQSFTHPLLEIRARTRNPHLFRDLPQLLDVSFYGYKYQVAVPDQAEAETIITQYLKDRNVELLSIRPVAPSMEEVFVLLAEKAVS